MFPWCWTLSLRSLGKIFLNVLDTHCHHFVLQNSLMNLKNPWYLCALEDSSEMSCFIKLESKK